MANWAYIPAWDTMSTPSTTEIVENGATLGANNDGDENYAVLSAYVSMGKVAYYKFGYDPELAVVIAVRSSEYNLIPPTATFDILKYAVEYISGAYSSILNNYVYQFSATYGDFNYLASTTGIANVSETYCNPSIPIYNNLQDALDALNDGIWERPTDDPYEDGGNSTTGGGGGTFDITGDPIPIPSLPSLSACDTGFISLYNPTLSELRSLASYMWTGAFDVNNFKKLFADPMDAILGLSIVPFNVTAVGQRELKVGNVGTGIQMSYIDDQWAEVDCGALTLPEFWGAYLDYSPYTKLELFLPYIGIRTVDADEIIGRPVNIVYHIDVVSGSCNAFVKVGDSVLYTYSGQCAVSLPVTSTDWSRTITDAISLTLQVAGVGVTGGATPVSALGLANSALNTTVKPTISKSGSVSGTSGYLAIQRPYFTITRPRQALPRGQNAYIGYPSFVTKQIGECSGYTEIHAIHIEGVPATGSELSEIENLLKGGVIL